MADDPKKNLETSFHEEMKGIYHRALNECQYRATRFLQMVNEQGGVQAAKSLLHASGYSEGLTALWERGRLDLTMEALISNDKERWSGLFTDEELSVAQKRLQELNYNP